MATYPPSNRLCAANSAQRTARALVPHQAATDRRQGSGLHELPPAYCGAWASNTRPVHMYIRYRPDLGRCVEAMCAWTEAPSGLGVAKALCGRRAPYRARAQKLAQWGVVKACESQASSQAAVASPRAGGGLQATAACVLLPAAWSIRAADPGILRGHRCQS